MLPKFFFIISLLSSFIFTTCSYTQCLHHQQTLLLQLKNELIFNSSISTKLVQWNERDECCKWYGVECDAAGYVISLQLDGEAISGGIGDSSSLFKLEYLQKLNLANNKFNFTPVPKGIHNLSYLTHLNLSYGGFGGQVPVEISSLKKLVSLDISSNVSLQNDQWFHFVKLEYPNLEMFVQNLTGLRELYLDYVNITSDERTKWSHIISSYLPNITSLSMVDCGLSGPLARSFGHLHSLSFLRLDGNELSTAVPDLFSNLPNLTTLSLSSCGLKGSIPSTFANLTKLMHLDLSDNLLTGSLSSTLFEGLSSLVSLDLESNSLSGNIPPSLFGLPSLLELDLWNNQFNGTFHLDNIKSLPNLTYLDLSHNSLSVDVGIVNSSTYRHHQLKVLDLASCNLSDFPEFIKYMDMEVLDLSRNRIDGEIPNWIWGTKIQSLVLSFNLLTGLQKPYDIPSSLQNLYLDSNRLRGELYLPIPPASQLSRLSLANNSLSGLIPSSLCNATYLDFSLNKFSGTIPSCLLENNKILRVLNLGRNNISGSIPDNFSLDCSLQYFDVNNNALEGKIPKSLESCRSLEFMNVGNNNFNDSFPCMLSASSLRVLVLRSNRFHGEVTITCHKSWPKLQVLDISSNNFSGSLESINFSSWRAMVLGVKYENLFGYYSVLVIPGVKLAGKGVELDIHEIWSDFGTIDLSCNNFQGEIPNAIGDLTSLHFLNFSGNALNGSIPKSFGKLSNLESLDLSRNQLAERIPVELGGLTFLSFLNLSYNKLVGEIPKGTQLETLTADSFKGNAGLCGLINLNISCSGTDEKDVSPPDHEDVEENKEIEWEYVSAALGYVVGLGSIVWLLLFCRSFRKKYFDKIEEVVEEICDSRSRRRTSARSVVRNRVRRQ